MASEDKNKSKKNKKKEKSTDVIASEPEAFYEYFGTVKADQLPLIYSDRYNISFMGLEKLHPFDRFVL